MYDTSFLLLLFFFFFFFQAEDGIRDFCLSRGLGDVYKRQASPRIDGKVLVLTDPMLATGGSMELSYKALLTKGTPKDIHIASVIASRQAIDYVKDHFPENTTIWVGAIDDKLDEHSYIVPGLGDAGDLAYGIKE